MATKTEKMNARGPAEDFLSTSRLGARGAPTLLAPRHLPKSLSTCVSCFVSVLSPATLTTPSAHVF
eukprot:7993120-Lingulodinium_polyedra.AAC.1